MKSMGETQEEYYRGVRMVPYDLVKELVIALVGVGVLALAVSAILSSPDVPPVTIAAWAQSDPVDFVTTANGELAGSTTSAGYGNPYDTNSDGQAWGPIAPQKWFGTRIPIDSADMCKALATATVTGGNVVVANGDYGPLPVMMSGLLGVAQAGGLDGLLQINGRFYQTDYTPALLFMGDGGYLSAQAEHWNLLGDQWGMMNETGRYPGQTWLWLYTMWYQVPPFTSDTGFLGLNASNADLGIIILMTLLTAALALVPFIPILRDIPRWVPIHRLIWRDYYAPRRKVL